MTKNMGTVDRSIRILIAIALIVLFATGRIASTLAIVLGVIAIAFLVTSAIAWCPSYLPFGVSTRKSSSGTAPPQTRT
jgi:hypothetical protein